MGELGAHLESTIVDVTRMSLTQLAMLDDTVFEESVDQLLRTCGTPGDRHWNFGQHM